MANALPRWRLALLLGGAAALIVATLSARMLLGARHEVQRAEAALARGEQTRGDRHLRRAMAYHLPFNPWVRHAAQTLRRRAKLAETRGERSRALDRWRALRSAILALRGATTPFSELLPEANRRIAALSAVAPRAASALKTPAGQRALLERLERPEEPHRAWVALGLLGFVGWIAAAFWLIARGFDARLQPHRGRLWLPLGLLVLSLGAFIAGMAFA